MMQTKILSPIVLFVYNRPAHTRQTVEALQKNLLAQDSDLIIFSDAAKTSGVAVAVREVRDYIHQVVGFKSIKIIERDKNWGLADSIIDGVTSVVNEYGRVIVLEDDLETSPYFLRFMNDALAFYASVEQVMHISGCRYPVASFGTSDTFFLRVPLCWGWATWQRAWSAFDKDIAIMNRFDHKMVSHFDFDNTYSYWEQLELNRSKQFETWFVFWYANIFLRGGLSLFPTRSLVSNIGMDGSGTHGGSSVYDVALSTEPVKVALIPLEVSNAGFESHKRYFKKIKSMKPNLIKRGIRKINKIIKSTKLMLFNLLPRKNQWFISKIYFEHKYAAQNLTIGYMARFNNCNFGNYNTLYDGAELSGVDLGDFTYVGSNNRLSKTTVGKFSCLGPDIIIGLGKHPSRDFVSTHPAFYSTFCQAQVTFVSQTCFEEFTGVQIGNDVWIGARAIILDGVVIGDGAIVGAGALVTKDVPPYAVVGGVPAKVLRYRFEPKEIEYLQQFKWWDKDMNWLRENAAKFQNIREFMNSDLE